MTRQRGPVECQSAILLVLRDEPTYHSDLRRQTRLDGSTIYRHLDHLEKEGLIEEWVPPFAVKRNRFNRKYWHLTAKGFHAAKSVQLTLEWLGLPDPREGR